MAERSFEPAAGFPAVYLRFLERAAAHDGKHCTPASNLLFDWLNGVPLRFSDAAGLTPHDVDRWLGAHSLEEGWLERYPGKLPLAFFDDDTKDPEDRIRELICTDVSRAECPVLMFAREGALYRMHDGLESFLETLGEGEYLEPAPPPEREPATADEHWKRYNERAAARDFEGALSDLQAVRRLDPDRVATEAAIAVLHREAGNLDEALRWIDRYLQHPDDSYPGSRIRARIQRQRGNPELALADAERAVEDRPDDRQALQIRGELRFELGDPEGACADIERALDVTRSRVARRKLQELLQRMESHLDE